jgi:hypothetical protein
MFRFGKDSRKERREQKQLQQVSLHVQAIQRQVFEILRRELVKTHEAIEGGRLAQAVTDRLFARPAAVHGEEFELVRKLSDRLAKENSLLRNAAFVTLEAMLQIEGAKSDLKPERRIIETIHWLEQFGAKPKEMTLAEALDAITNFTLV